MILAIYPSFVAWGGAGMVAALGVVLLTERMTPRTAGRLSLRLFGWLCFFVGFLALLWGVFTDPPTRF